MVGSIVAGICVGVLVVMVNEAYRRNLKKEINEVKEEILILRQEQARRDGWMIKDLINVYEKDKEIMKILKGMVERSNEEE